MCWTSHHSFSPEPQWSLGPHSLTSARSNGCITGTAHLVSMVTDVASQHQEHCVHCISLSDFVCQWFTSLWMIQSLVSGWKHRVFPLGLLSLIEMCLLPQKARQPFWHHDKEPKVCVLRVCVVCAHVCDTWLRLSLQPHHQCPLAF